MGGTSKKHSSKALSSARLNASPLGHDDTGKFGLGNQDTARLQVRNARPRDSS